MALAFYGPVLGPALSSAQSLTSGGLPWHGFITGPLVDLLAPSVQLFVAPASLTVAEVVAAGVLLYGAFVLVRAWERVLALILLLPTPVTYLAFQITGATTADRFMSFLLLPLLLLVAVGLAGAEICGNPGAFAYVEHDRAPSPQLSTTCLEQRGAVAYKLAQLRGEITVWLVPARSA